MPAQSTCRLSYSLLCIQGLPPALVRQACYGGLRYGLYAPIRNQIGVSENTPKDQVNSKLGKRSILWIRST